MVGCVILRKPGQPPNNRDPTRQSVITRTRLDDRGRLSPCHFHHHLHSYRSQRPQRRLRRQFCSAATYSTRQPAARHATSSGLSRIIRVGWCRGRRRTTKVRRAGPGRMLGYLHAPPCATRTRLASPSSGHSPAAGVSCPTPVCKRISTAVALAEPQSVGTGMARSKDHPHRPHRPRRRRVASASTLSWTSQRHAQLGGPAQAWPKSTRRAR